MTVTLLLSILGICSVFGADVAPTAYPGEIESWRRDYEAKLRAADGWLTVAGLFWLKPGETRLGSAPENDIILPAHTPDRVGVLKLDETGKAFFRVKRGVKASLAGKPFTLGGLRSDAEGIPPDVLEVGDVRLLFIKRGSRYALRLKDNRSEIRSKFAGLQWFPVDHTWRIQGRFVKQPDETRIAFDTIIGETESLRSPGYVEFERDGRPYRLQAAAEGDHLWFVFRDGTSGKTTHSNARQLTVDRPGADGVVLLDFNKAVNLPCAYTPYATCPIAPRQNRLSLAITAGEKQYESALDKAN